MPWHMPMEMAVTVERRVRLFRNGRNQAVRIPRELELPGEAAIMRREGQRLVIEPAPLVSLLAVLATLKPIDDDFPPIQELPLRPVEL
jgi:antitoxin VapB